MEDCEMTDIQNIGTNNWNICERQPRLEIGGHYTVRRSDDTWLSSTVLEETSFFWKN
ncbi:hypothetical protein X975_25116, partial [Stegodyphus mimosarum]